MITVYVAYHRELHRFIVSENETTTFLEHAKEFTSTYQCMMYLKRVEINDCIIMSYTRDVK